MIPCKCTDSSGNLVDMPVQSDVATEQPTGTTEQTDYSVCRQCAPQPFCPAQSILCRA